MESSEVASRFSSAQIVKEPNSNYLSSQIRGVEIFHFSGHGWSNGGNGGLLLSSGQLADEPAVLSSRTISGQDWSACKIVVLSACLTATGEGHGVVSNESLVQALLGAGAQRVIAARWSVDSESSRFLMGKFYDSIIAGKTPAEALALAAAETRAIRDWAHPYYWAGFDVYGSI
jgi:CHAT domain-containing protein